MKKLSLRTLIILFLGFSSIFSSCSKDDEQPKEEKDKYLVSTEVKYAYSEAQIEGAIGIPGAQDIIVNGIITYKLSYTTVYEGKKITSSGTLTLPDKPGKYPLALVERGTILSNSEAPSEQYSPSYQALSGMGYVIFVPDMIGYGDSNDILHPYLDYQYSASASVDMYYAVNEFFKDKSSTTINDKFFITGYSQGGYSAMATYKYIIENDLDIDINAVGPGAGGYDVMALVDNILKEDTYPATILLTMPMITYNELYIHKPTSDIMNAPFDAMVQDVIDGKKEWSDIAYSLPPIIKLVFNNTLIDDLKAGNTTILTQPILDNSVHNWAPKKPLRLYHYPLDEIIPIATTHSTLQTMLNNGSTDVKFVEIPASLVGNGASPHGAAGFGALFLAFTEFGKY